MQVKHGGGGEGVPDTVHIDHDHLPEVAGHKQMATPVGGAIVQLCAWQGERRRHVGGVVGIDLEDGVPPEQVEGLAVGVER